MPLLDKLQKATESVVETEDVLEPDPAPDERPARKPRAPRQKTVPVRKVATKSINTMAKEVGRDLGSMIEMVAAAWSLRDQCCAPVLAAQSKPIGDAMANILARNPDLLAKFANAESGMFVMQVVALGTALAPVARAIMTNHVMKPEQLADDATDIGNFPAFSGVPRAHPA